MISNLSSLFSEINREIFKTILLQLESGDFLVKQFSEIDFPPIQHSEFEILIENCRTNPLNKTLEKLPAENLIYLNDITILAALLRIDYLTKKVNPDFYLSVIKQILGFDFIKKINLESLAGHVNWNEIEENFYRISQLNISDMELNQPKADIQFPTDLTSIEAQNTLQELKNQMMSSSLFDERQKSLIKKAEEGQELSSIPQQWFLIRKETIDTKSRWNDGAKNTSGWTVKNSNWKDGKGIFSIKNDLHKFSLVFNILSAPIKDCLKILGNHELKFILEEVHVKLQSHILGFQSIENLDYQSGFVQELIQAECEYAYETLDKYENTINLIKSQILKSLKTSKNEDLVEIISQEPSSISLLRIDTDQLQDILKVSIKTRDNLKIIIDEFKTKNVNNSAEENIISLPEALQELGKAFDQLQLDNKIKTEKSQRSIDKASQKLNKQMDFISKDILVRNEKQISKNDLVMFNTALEKIIFQTQECADNIKDSEIKSTLESLVQTLSWFTIIFDRGMTLDFSSKIISSNMEDIFKSLIEEMKTYNQKILSIRFETTIKENVFTVKTLDKLLETFEKLSDIDFLCQSFDKSLSVFLRNLYTVKKETEVKSFEDMSSVDDIKYQDLSTPKNIPISDLKELSKEIVEKNDSSFWNGILKNAALKVGGHVLEKSLGLKVNNAWPAVASNTENVTQYVMEQLYKK